MEIEDYYYQEDEDDFYDTKGNTYECQKGGFEGFYTSSPDLCKKELPSSSLLPSIRTSNNKSRKIWIIYLCSWDCYFMEVTKISTVINQVSRFSQPLSGTTPHAIAFDLEHHRIYVTNRSNHIVSVIIYTPNSNRITNRGTVLTNCNCIRARLIRFFQF